MKTWHWVVVGLLLVLLSGGLAWYTIRDYRAFLDSPLAVPDAGVEFTIPAGQSIRDITRRLQKQGILRSALYLQAYARSEGLAYRIKAGEYLLKPGTTPRTLLEQWVAGRVIQYPLTIVEGWTFRRMLEAVAGHPKLQHTLTGLDNAAIMARLGYPGQHPEGRFFPDTYYFPAGTSDVDLLKRAYTTLERRLQETWEKRSSGLPLKTPYEALILASIVEKETALPNERQEIAGVFVRRLQKGMLLQTDPTVIYGLGDRFDGNLHKQDLLADTPYNTYTRPGLPPTPIALPGAASIAAAVDPAKGDTLYFVATGEGRHVFSRTLEEHNRWVHRYQLNKH
jgi:UPF0755 protein